MRIWRLLETLLGASEITVDENYTPAGASPSGVSDLGAIFMPLEGIVDIEEEKAKLNKQKAELEKAIGGTKGKLSNENFVSRAPEAVVNKEKEKLAEYEEKLVRVIDLLNSL